MATVTFRSKIQERTYTDGTLYQRFIPVPAKIERKHCDMAAFRSHARFGSYANSDLFPALLKRALKDIGITDRIVMADADGSRVLPAGVRTEEGFLTTVHIDLP